jgi:PAS domain S-box-containing protein
MQCSISNRLEKLTYVSRVAHMRRPANRLLDVGLGLVLCAFVAWLAWSERLRGGYVIAGGFLCGLGAGLIMALLVQRKRRRQVEPALDECLHTDTLRRQHAEQALKDSEAKIRALFASNLIPMNYWHADGRILEANDAYLRLTGFSREEIKTGHVRWDLLTAPEERTLHLRALAEFTAGRETCTPYEKEYQLRDGQRVPVLISGVLLPGYTDRGMGFFLDLRERKQAEVALQKAQADLVHVTRVLMMGELATSLAHEISQPLAAVLYNAQAAQRFLAKDTPDLPAVREALADIIEDDKRAVEVLHRLRSLLRKSPLELLPVNLNEVIREVVKLLNSDMIIRHVSLVLDLAPDLPLVRGDHVQLQQVLLNLMLNGFEAMAELALEHRQLGIQTQQVSAHRVEVAVHDCGVGLDANKLEQIFEPFYTTKPTGMGMGLAICRSILEAHSGCLWAANNPDRGATFYFTLPVNA